MASKHFLRESAGAVASPIALITVEGAPADWIQSVAGGAMTLKDGGGTSVTIAAANAGDVFPGPIREITSSAGKVRYGTGELPRVAAPSTSLVSAGITNVDVTLIAGTKTLASGLDLTNAKIVGAPRFKTLNASPALGAEVLASLSGNNIVLTSYGTGGAAATTDVATYTVSLTGAV